jgi:SAM-dependent methyltransferase
LLNWKIRYSKILLAVPELSDPESSVVEVGCGPAGITEFLDRKVIGIEPNPVVARNKNLEIIEGSVMALPFPDNAIDYVLCVDVMEHLPAELRAGAIGELLRIARKKVIISCPCHDWATAGELELKQMFEKTGFDVPDWLQEHLDFGLPSVHEILRPIAATGYEFEVAGNETMLQHYAGVALDKLFPSAPGMNTRLHAKSPLQPPIRGNEWDLHYSFMFTIKKADAKVARCSQGELSKPRLQPGAPPLSSDHAIYAVYHKNFPLSHLGLIKPIFVGDLAQSHASLGLTDICVKGAGLSNRRWSELSAIYKIWTEGPGTSVVGFCHYRRLFDFSDHGGIDREGLSLSRDTNVTAGGLADGSHRLYDAELVSAVGDGTKIIVAIPHDTTNTIFEHYCEIHHTNDYLELLNQCVALDSPLLPFFIEQFSDHFLYANNMFIVSWALFSELCGFWFELLNSFVAKFPERQSSAYQHRDVAFLSERIFDAWIRYRKKCGNEIIELPILFVPAEVEELSKPN